MPNEKWTTEEYQHWLRTGKRPDSHNRISGSDGEPQRSAGNAAQNPDALQEVVSEYRLTVYHYRHRLPDFDNLFTKHFTDAIVDSGLLPNDTPEKVVTVHKQIKIPKTMVEKTVFVIEAI